MENYAKSLSFVPTMKPLKDVNGKNDVNEKAVSAG